MYPSFQDPSAHLQGQSFPRDAFGQTSGYNDQTFYSNDFSYWTTYPLQHLPQQLYQQLFIPSSSSASAAPTLFSAPFSSLPLGSNEFNAGHAYPEQAYQLSVFSFPDMSHSTAPSSWSQQQHRQQQQQMMTDRPSQPPTRQPKPSPPSHVQRFIYSGQDNQVPSSLPSQSKSQAKLAAFSRQQINVNDDSPPPATVTVATPSSSSAFPPSQAAAQASYYAIMDEAPVAFDYPRDVSRGFISTSLSGSRKRRRSSVDEEEEDLDAEGKDNEDVDVILPTTRKGSGQSAAKRGKQRDSDERSKGRHETSEEEPGRDNYWGKGKETYQALTAVEKKQLRNKLGARKFRSRRKGCPLLPIVPLSFLHCHSSSSSLRSGSRRPDFSRMSSQQASLSGAILSSATDALVLLEAVRLCSLPRIFHRLTKAEREHLIKDGQIFVWEEAETQMQRWTDGRRWSCSRVCNEFLAYDELEAGTNPTSCVDNKRLKNGLIKTSFASHLILDGDLPRRFHVVAYHHPSSVPSLIRPSHNPQLIGLDTSHWRGPVHGRKAASSSVSSSSFRRRSLPLPSSRPYSHQQPTQDRSTSVPSPALPNASSNHSHSRSVSSSLFTFSALGSHSRPASGEPHPPSLLTTPPLHRSRDLNPQPLDPSNYFQPPHRPTLLLALPPLASTVLPNHLSLSKSPEDFRMLGSIPVRI